MDGNDMDRPLTPQPGIMEISPYQGGKSKLSGTADVVKLSSNENAFGAPDTAREAYARAVHALHRYPDGGCTALRAAIGKVHDLDPERVVCGAGSDELIQFLCNAYAGPGDEVIHTQHGFLMYRIYALAAGATPVEVPEVERCVDVDAILAAVSFRTRIVFIANPANPTGNMVARKDMARLADALPEGVLLVLDGAYAEYAEGFDGGRSLVDKHSNVVMLRTFSKIYGLSALRVGWGYAAPEIVDVLNRMRGPFNVGQPQQDAAEAAVLDQAFVTRCQSENARLRTWLSGALAEAGVACDTSYANFVLARFASPEEAAACDAHLQGEGLIVRAVAGYKLPECLRITIGDEASCRRVAHAIRTFRETQS